MIESDRQHGKPARLYRDTKANIAGLGLGAADEGCIAYATDTNEFGSFDGAAWAWSNHNLLGSRHSDTTTDAVTRGSMITGNATPAWDELAHPGAAYHLQTSAADIFWSQNIVMTDNAWIGVDALAERIVFDAAGDITVMGARFGVNVAAPAEMFEVFVDEAGFVGKFQNDGNNDDRWGIIVMCGLDTNPASRFINFSDGNGTTIGYVIGDGAGGVTYWSASDERRKNILGPIDPVEAMRALAEVDAIQYVGEGLTAETGRKAIGFSAQAMLKHFPEAVSYNKERDEYGLGYERLVPVLWAQNKALLARIEAGGL